MRRVVMAAVIVAAMAGVGASARQPRGGHAEIARQNGIRFERSLAAMQRLLHAWLAHADSRTGLLPDRVPGAADVPPEERGRGIYRPHNSGADLYPYLILTAHLTDPELLDARLLEMLRSEIRHTTVLGSIPANLNLTTGELGPPNFFGAGEYAKDGLVSVTEYLGRTPWFHRMVDMIADAMEHAPVSSKFGALPAGDAELNGDYLQVLARLAAMTGDPRFLAWGRRIADAYIEEVLPGNHGVPSSEWDFTAHAGNGRLRFRDHGNETIVGLVLQFAIEDGLKSERAERWRPVIARMLDRVLASANPDGLLYNEVDARTLAPVSDGLSDNWGYVYGAVYTFYQRTSDERYRDAVIRVLRNLPKYRRHVWEPRPRNPGLPLGSFDGYADAIESAIYLVNREPVAEALDWIESEMTEMLAMQRADGHIEYWYGEGNFNRTVMLYALMKSQGVRPRHWVPGVRVGAVRESDRLHLSLDMPSARAIQFDHARHRRTMNLDRNYVRLNELPEWFVVDENTLYRVAREREPAAGDIRLGSELISGIDMAPGDWVVTPLGPAPYAASFGAQPR
jgi:hypothetical protein